MEAPRFLPSGENSGIVSSKLHGPAVRTHPNNKNTMKKRELESAKYLLSRTKLSLIDTVRLVVEMLEESPAANTKGKEEAMRHCRRIIQMGSEAHKLSTKSVSLKVAVEELLDKKSGVRERTLHEIRQICARFMASSPGFEDVLVRDISTETCQQVIDEVFTTVPMRRKAKRILNSLFMNSIISGWCASNPVAGVTLPQYQEKPIKSLSIREVMALLKTALEPEHLPCAPALGIMLWTGIRPHEVERLTVANINFEDQVITVPARHAKTGGARQVTMHPVLRNWLRATLKMQYPTASIVPLSWLLRWARLRQDAGFKKWVPDVLRHTFASYHLKYFKSVEALQIEMGHTTPELLRTRYLAMEGVTAKGAMIYWNYGRKLRL